MDEATRLSPGFDLACLVKVCFLRGHKPRRDGLQERFALLIHPCCSHIPSLGDLTCTPWGQSSLQHGATCPSVGGVREGHLHEQANAQERLLAGFVTSCCRFDTAYSCNPPSEEGTWLIQVFICRKTICECLASRPGHILVEVQTPQSSTLPAELHFKPHRIHLLFFFQLHPIPHKDTDLPSQNNWLSASYCNVSFLCTKIRYKTSS